MYHRQDARPSRKSSFSAVPGFVKLARDFAVDVAQSNGWKDDFTLSLLVSELATNSVQARASTFTIVVFEPYEDETGRYLRFEVTDDCSTVPAPKQTMPKIPDDGVPPESGRGLPLVEALSEEWYPERRDVGKAICVTLKEERDAPARSCNPQVQLTTSVA